MSEEITNLQMTDDGLSEVEKAQLKGLARGMYPTVEGVHDPERWADQAAGLAEIVVAQIVAVRLAPVEAEVARLTAELDHKQAMLSGIMKALPHDWLEQYNRAAKLEALVEAGLALADEFEGVGREVNSGMVGRLWVVRRLRDVLGGEYDSKYRD